MEFINIITVVSAFLQIIILIVQAIIMYKVGKMSKMATSESMDRTEIISKNQRFAKYDSDLNLVLLEFWNCYKEIEGFKCKLSEFERCINNPALEHKKVGIDNMHKFLEKFNLPIQFKQMSEKEYVFLLKEEMKNTIWEGVWDDPNFNFINFQVNLYDFIDETVALSQLQSQMIDTINHSFFENVNGKYQLKDDSVFKNNELLSEVKSLISEMHTILNEINECVKKFNDTVSKNSNFYKVMQGRKDAKKI